MPYQSPISPGRSWYEDTAGPRPEYKALDGDLRCDVVVVGGGFTGLSAAVHLARAGSNVVLIDAHRFGDGASGRNGGQLGTGQRAWAEELAQLFEQTPATAIASVGGKVRVTTPKGTISAGKCLIGVNAHGGTLEPISAAHIMPIGSFIGATVPLADSSVLPGGEAVDDSRFVVRYFRKSTDGRLLFGGREIYAVSDPKDIHVHIRRQIAELYPDLRDVEITHGWGGYVGITMPRKPFVREVMPNVISVGGYSGHGVMLSNFFGKLYAETVAGNRDRLRLIEDLNIPAFPGGRRLRAPLLFLALNWYALRDRI
ncbi:MAG: FAD-binding oxidoreductase [Mesorhizobium sp.]|uniref:NAD(P)/FAD-dependent oxidoreductase n=1 Tax=Mesorhizobium sp. TaxID=1871066 RepID=UPI000FE8D8FA|nr:FAD-binding oxidoreductase [Mesorhizobium sp.]RWQ48598.1 MAG: FAD-binding oxidoreductase [Mesorhizobium sp.]